MGYIICSLNKKMFLLSIFHDWDSKTTSLSKNCLLWKFCFAAYGRLLGKVLLWRLFRTIDCYKLVTFGRAWSLDHFYLNLGVIDHSRFVRIYKKQWSKKTRLDTRDKSLTRGGEEMFEFEQLLSFNHSWHSCLFLWSSETLRGRVEKKRTRLESVKLEINPKKFQPITNNQGRGYCYQLQNPVSKDGASASQFQYFSSGDEVSTYPSNGYGNKEIFDFFSVGFGRRS